jgi:glycosyltransferase A (GT-A) superfamily protein (DUF2064 family)
LAALAASESQVTLVPATDGGYVSIGLYRTPFDLFREIPWSTQDVLKITLQRVKSLGLNATLLPEWYDVDDTDDLDRLVQALSDLPASRAIETRAALGRWL